MKLKRVPYQRVPHTAAQAGLEARQLVQLLSPCTPGDIVTYEEMQEVTGIDMQQRRDLLQTALEIVQQTYQKVFAPAINIGMRCLSEPEKVGYAESKTQRIARASLKNLKMMSTVQHEQLSPLDRFRLEAHQTVMAAVHLYTHEKTLIKLEAREPLPALPIFDQEAHARLSHFWAPG